MFDRTSQTSNICNVLSTLYHPYFRQVALAVFSYQAVFDLSLLLWFLLLDTWEWPEHKVPRKEGLSFHLSVFPIVCPSILPSIQKYSQNLPIWFFWNLVWCQGPIFSYMWQQTLFEKNDIKNGQKGSKSQVFWTFIENQVI